MRLRTKKAVTFNKPMSGTNTQILIGEVLDQLRQGDNYYGANYTYLLADGTPLIRDAFHLRTKEAILEVVELIKGDLPKYEETPEPEFEELKIYLAFRLEMFKLLTKDGLNPKLKLTDIEIIDSI